MRSVLREGVGYTMRTPAALTWVAVLCCAGFVAAEETSAPPKLERLFPAGGQRGTTVVTTCTGEFVWPVEVWAPGVEVAVEEVKEEQEEKEGKLAISIPEDLAADRVWIRLYNAEGASEAVPFLIGGLEESVEEEPNDSPRDAQELPEADVTINGVLAKRGEVDSFAVCLSAGQTLVAAVDAHSRLGSPMDAILQVVSRDGIVLAENHDDLGLDPRLAFTVTESGTYVVRVFAFPSEPNSQIAFHGGDAYIYRLTLTTGPYITHAAELAVCEKARTVEPRGWNIPRCVDLPVVPFGGAACGEHFELEAATDVPGAASDRLGFAFVPGCAGGARVRLVPHPVTRGDSEADERDVLALAPPNAVTGCIRMPGETDEYRVTLKKGERVAIAVQAQGFDLPLVPLVRLMDPEGKVAAETPERGPARDAVLRHTASDDGEYRLAVGDRFGHGGRRYSYLATVRHDEPDFELSVDAESIVVTEDEPAEMKVTVQRRAASGESIGPITIEAVDLPPGVTAPAVVSEVEGETAKEVTLTFATTGPAFSGPIRIRGTAAESCKIERFACTPPKHGASFESIWLTAVAEP